jgi:fatty-acyl-CoA synthase
VSINTRFRAGEIEDLVARAGCRVLALWPEFQAIDCARILADMDPDALAGVTHTVCVGAVPADTTRLPGEVVPFARLLAGPVDVQAPADADARCLIFTTSGTTSAPKFVCHVQGALTRHAREVATAFEFDAPRARILQALPLCGVFGFCQALAGLAAAAPLFLVTVFDAAHCAALIRAHEITHLCGSDEMMDRLLAARPEPRPFPSLRCAAYASFNPALEAVAAAAEARGIRMRGLYGMSECQALFALQAGDAPFARRTQGGGLPVSPAAEVRIRDPETGVLLPPGQTGEIELRGPSLFREYFGDPAATARAFDDEGWFRTGDLGERDADGGFRYLTRMGDVLRLGGFLVSPAEIEQVLDAHGSIVASQVVGVLDTGRPVAIAFVIPRDDAACDEAALRDWCAARLARYKVPARVFAVAEFPVTASANGTKIQRARLRGMALALIANVTAG